MINDKGHFTMIKLMQQYKNYVHLITQPQIT